MNTQIILLAVIVVVILIDFVLRGIKKNKVKDEAKKIGKENILSFKYFIRRKRNIITFVLLSVILKPVFVFLISPNFIEFIDYEQKIERESFLKNKVDLFNTYPSTVPEENPKAYYIKDLPKFFNDENSIKYHIDSILPRYIFELERTSKHDYIFKNDLLPVDYYQYRYILRSKPTIYLDDSWDLLSGGRGYYFDEITEEKKYTEIRPVLKFEKLPTKNEMLNCCNIHYDFNYGKFYDKNGNELFHKTARRYGSTLDDFYFYPLVKKVDSFRNHFKEIFKSKHEYFGISLILLALIIFLLNDRIAAR